MTDRLPHNMHPDCRAYAAKCMAALCDWLKARSKEPQPPELEKMFHELKRRERASFVWREDRRWRGRVYGLKRNRFEPRNNWQRYEDANRAWFRRRRDHAAYLAHLEACRKWRDANRDYIRAANRLRYWQRKAALSNRLDTERHLTTITIDHPTTRPNEANMAPRKERLTVEEVARLSGFSRQTIHDWISSGDAPKRVKIGRRRYFMRDDVLAWLQARQRERSAV